MLKEWWSYLQFEDDGCCAVLAYDSCGSILKLKAAFDDVVGIAGKQGREGLQIEIFTDEMY